jgi:hypothetical protein
MGKRRTPSIWAFIVVGSIIAILAGAYIYAGSAYAGGWETQNAISRVTLDAQSRPLEGLHSYSWDTDGVWEEGEGVTSTYDDPTIRVKTSYPFYLKQVSGKWVETDAPHLLDSYSREYSDTLKQVYNHYVFGYTITFQTLAKQYYKSQAYSVFDYGFWYEDDVIDATARVEFGINPWTPTGAVDDWNVVGGWAGIMSASAVSVEMGIVDLDKTENQGHTIEPHQSVGDALNMYGAEPLEFTDPTALEGVPQKAEIECGARLGAGALYTTDVLSKVNSIAVRNVYVLYTVRVDVMTTLQYELQVGKQTGQEPPVSNNTAYMPTNTPWTQFMEGMVEFGDWFTQFGMPFLVVIIIGVVIIVILYYTGPLLRGLGKARGG